MRQLSGNRPTTLLHAICCQNLRSNALLSLNGSPPPKMVRPIVISGPSGCGKSTLLARAMKEYPNAFAFSISHTTRKPRDGELDKKHYYFVEQCEMERMIRAGDFFEHAQFGGNLYGTSKKAVEDVQSSGKVCVLDVELNGVRPPSIEALEQRLRQRGSETEDSLAKRLKHAQEDLEAVAKQPTLFDYVIINDILDRAYIEFLDVVRPELESVQLKKQ
uniref:Guanylate kinase-like domain-containing protein n=1 Tax=Globodera rostochiensis TaxID=31243 RepID=A0A914HVI5_GLORO